MTRKIYGLLVDNESRCQHYHTELDIVALKCFDCLKYYACYQCHDRLGGTHSFRADVYKRQGYFDYYSPERLQLVGMKEWSYLKTMTANNRYSVFANIFREETPAVVVARGLEIPEEMLQAAKENGVAVLQGRNSTSSLSGDMSWYLNSQLAERTSVHGEMCIRDRLLPFVY